MLAEDSNVILMLEFAQLGLSGNSTEMGQQLAAYLRSQEPVIRPELSANPFIAAKEINLLFDPESDWYKTGTTEQIKMINDQIWTCLVFCIFKFKVNFVFFCLISR